MYKFNIIKSVNGYMVHFLYNSTVIFWTENYTSEANALNAINSIKQNSQEAIIYRNNY